jgi:hypothetical protein
MFTSREHRQCFSYFVIRQDLCPLKLLTLGLAAGLLVSGGRLKGDIGERRGEREEGEEGERRRGESRGRRE